MGLIPNSARRWFLNCEEKNKGDYRRLVILAQDFSKQNFLLYFLLQMAGKDSVPSLKGQVKYCSKFDIES